MIIPTTHFLPIYKSPTLFSEFCFDAQEAKISSRFQEGDLMLD